MRGRGFDAMLAAAATLAAAWPVSTLLAEPSWLGGTVLLLAVVAVSGIGARSLALRGWQVLIVQLVCVILTAGGIYGRGHLWHGLPTFETLGFAGELIGEAMTTVQAYAAPAPTTPGLSFVVGCALALVALAVDYLAVTRRSPSLAGLPLLTAFLSSAANSGSSLPVFFFLAAAGIWLVLVARSGSAILRRWGTTVAVARTPVRERLDTQSVYGYASTARTLGVLALVAAVGLPVVLPQLPPKFILSGLGRSSSATGVGGAVGFSLNLDVAADLRSQSTVPVLQYQTTDPSPPPLRVAVSSLYDSSRGAWVPRRETAPILSGKPDIPPPTGLSNDVPRKRFAMTFERNLLDRPNLAAPYPLVSADLHDIGWGLDEESQDVTVAERPDSYALSYWRLEPTAAMLQRAVVPSGSAEGSIEGNLELDDRSFESVMEQSTRLTMGKTSAYDRAMAIQEHLRASGGFTYSLDLAAPTRDPSGELSDPLTHFLTTKRGYCVQFATAMVMMSRAAGIPARMAIGFLPGTSSKGVWAVTASQAHTWPELYLDGIGWTRFEPTPSRGAPPVYAVPPTPGGVQGGGGRPVDETRTPTPAPSAQGGSGRSFDRQRPQPRGRPEPGLRARLVDARLGAGPARFPGGLARRPGRAHCGAVATSTRAHHRQDVGAARGGPVGASDVIAGRSRDRARCPVARPGSYAPTTTGRRSLRGRPPRPWAGSCRHSNARAMQRPLRFLKASPPTPARCSGPLPPTGGAVTAFAQPCGPVVASPSFAQREQSWPGASVPPCAMSAPLCANGSRAGAEPTRPSRQVSPRCSSSRPTRPGGAYRFYLALAL